MTAALLDGHPLPAAARGGPAVARDYARVRAHSLALSAPLSAEDQCVQSMPDASPTKWHLAHTSWFFEAFVLQPHVPGYRPFDARYGHLFNSYYEALGPRHERPHRGLLTRPSLADVRAYRRHVDEAMHALMASGALDQPSDLRELIVLGLHHEQQHQELLLTDILHAFWCNPLLPAYEAVEPPTLRLGQRCEPVHWIRHPGGIEHVGHDGEGFAFDNEMPRHAALLQPFEIADRLVTCGEYAAFIADGGYARASLWLSDGWALVQSQGWRAPGYWLAGDDARLRPGHDASMWHVFGLGGVHPVDPLTPVTHLSFHEAVAYAGWAGARLPTESEWEAAAARAQGPRGLRQLTGHAWQWTRSSYDPYPGFRAPAGAVGEYNGKFMVGQMVLRGGSLATPEGHARPTYRNFFPPAARWQFSGLRLARDT